MTETHDKHSIPGSLKIWSLVLLSMTAFLTGLCMFYISHSHEAKALATITEGGVTLYLDVSFIRLQSLAPGSTIKILDTKRNSDPVTATVQSVKSTDDRCVLEVSIPKKQRTLLTQAECVVRLPDQALYKYLFK